MDPSPLTTAELCNLYSGAQHSFALAQGLVTPERLDPGMNPWGEPTFYETYGPRRHRERV